MSFTRFLLCIIPLAYLLGCSETPEDVSGVYTLSMTNRDNGCDFESWTVGETSSGVVFTLSQIDATVEGEIGGLAGAFLDLVLGARKFEGEVSDHSLSLILYGQNAASDGNCTYTVNGYMDGILDGDFLRGEIAYRPATNDNPDCMALEDCSSIQEFNGTRPPK